MNTPIKPTFTKIDGLPPADDPEVASLMEPVSRMDREHVEEIARNLLRCALGWQRTGNPDYLTALADDALVTIGYRRDPHVEEALRRAPKKPAGPGRTVDVEGMLRSVGL